MDPTLSFLALATLSAVGSFLLQRRQQRLRYSSISIACITCGSEEVQEHSPTDYRCSACGYDTMVPEDGDRGRLGAICRELGIFVARLESAEADFIASKQSGSKSSRSGPFPNVYGEARDQAGEVGEQIVEHGTLGPRLKERILPLFELPDVPARGGYFLPSVTFNSTAERARAMVRPVTAALRDERSSFIAQYQAAR